MINKEQKIEPPSEGQYTQEMYNLALNFCPPIHKCMKCGHPVVNGYCCTFCGDSDPRSKD